MVLNSGCPTDVTRAVELSGGHPLPRMVLNSGCPTDVTRAVELSGGQPLPRMVLIDLALVTATWQCFLNLAQLSFSELVVLISGIQRCRWFEQKNVALIFSYRTMLLPARDNHHLTRFDPDLMLVA